MKRERGVLCLKYQLQPVTSYHATLVLLLELSVHKGNVSAPVRFLWSSLGQ
jgi:hypothetical protein